LIDVIIFAVEKDRRSFSMRNGAKDIYFSSKQASARLKGGCLFGGKNIFSV